MILKRFSFKASSYQWVRPPYAAGSCLQESACLSSINLDINQNDIQIEKTRKYYLDNYGIDPFSKNQLSFTK